MYGFQESCFEKINLSIDSKELRIWGSQRITQCCRKRERDKIYERKEKLRHMENRVKG